jgi:hypothetical protein
MTADTLTLSNGTQVPLNRIDGIPDANWNELKQFLTEQQNVVAKHPDLVKFVCENPAQVKMLRDFTTNPEAIKAFLHAQTIVGHSAKNTEAEQEKFKMLKNDPELSAIFEDLEKNGHAAFQKYYNNEELMRKISAKMGGIEPFKAELEKIQQTPVTLHEAARDAKLDKVTEFLKSGVPVDQKDYKGVTALGYAVGNNNGAVVKVLLDAGASIVVDAVDNTALHYAAGYGRTQILQILLEARVSNLSPKNKSGQTPVGVAMQNQKNECAQLLQAKGGK